MLGYTPTYHFTSNEIPAQPSRVCTGMHTLGYKYIPLNYCIAGNFCACNIVYTGQWRHLVLQYKKSYMTQQVTDILHVRIVTNFRIL